MAKQSLNGVLQHLRTLAAVQTSRDLSDGDLLERFVEARDEGAFTALIDRHGPMVLGVCRRALPNFHDAEDACQATFLVLARKAASIRKQSSISSWLHGVACRVAVNLKREQARRKSRERAVDAPAPKDPAAEATWREVQSVLDDELQKLPERYRVPVILCYLECVTRDEAAQRLGLSSTTLHGRLERARELLRERLSRRGLTLSAVIFASAISANLAQAALAPTFVVSSTKAAMLLAAGRPVTERIVATKVTVLTEEVLKTMMLAKMKLGTVALLCAGLSLALLSGSFSSRGSAQQVKPSFGAVVDDKDKSASTQSKLQTEKKSGTLALESIDLAKGTIQGSRVDTNPERTFHSYRQASWELLVKPSTKITIDGKDAEFADLPKIAATRGGDWGKYVVVEADLEIPAGPKQSKRKGLAIRIDATGMQVRGVLQALDSGKNSVSIKKIGRGFGGDVVVSEDADDVPFAKDVHVTINGRSASLGDLKPNMKVLLQMSAVKELVLGMTAYGATVEGILKSVDAAKNVVSVTIPSAQMTAEGVTVAKYARVVIDGSERKLADLKTGMRVTLQMSAEPDQSVIVGITKERPQ